MKIRRQKRGIVMRIASVVAVSGLAIGGLFYGLNSVNATGLNKNYSYIKANYAVPNANVAWVSPNGDDNKGNGSESAPYKSFGRAVTKIGDGGTVVAKSGIYREPHFFVTKKNVTMQAAPNAEVWLKGSDVVARGQYVEGHRQLPKLLPCLYDQHQARSRRYGCLPRAGLY